MAVGLSDTEVVTYDEVAPPLNRQAVKEAVSGVVYLDEPPQVVLRHNGQVIAVALLPYLLGTAAAEEYGVGRHVKEAPLVIVYYVNAVVSGA